MHLIPLHLRELRAEMAMKGLSVKEVAERTRHPRIPYSTTSQVLNGRLISPERLKEIKRVIHSARAQQEVAA